MKVSDLKAAMRDAPDDAEVVVTRSMDIGKDRMCIEDAGRYVENRQFIIIVFYPPPPRV